MNYVTIHTVKSVQDHHLTTMRYHFAGKERIQIVKQEVIAIVIKIISLKINLVKKTVMNHARVHLYLLLLLDLKTLMLLCVTQ